MPLISSFYGILIRMYFFDIDQHRMPHVHAQYQGQHAQFAIDDGEFPAGILPRPQVRLVQAWIEIRRAIGGRLAKGRRRRAPWPDRAIAMTRKLQR